MIFMELREAKRLGVVKYNNGKCCPLHPYNSSIGCERYVSNKQCVEAFMQRSKKWYHTEKGKIYQKKKDRTPHKMEAKRRENYKQRGITPVSTIPYPENELCQICGKAETLKTTYGTVKRLCRDHDHITKKDRGWLCCRCNRSIGALGDNSLLLEKIIIYLKNK